MDSATTSADPKVFPVEASDVAGKVMLAMVLTADIALWVDSSRDGASGDRTAHPAGPNLRHPGCSAAQEADPVLPEV